jgi:hypothetical protein
MQDKARLGRRYTCFNCSCKFYDLNKPEPVCPKCNADQREDPAPDPRVAVMARYKTNRPSAKEMVPDLDEPDEDIDLDEEEDAFEDEEESPEGEEEDW